MSSTNIEKYLNNRALSFFFTENTKSMLREMKSLKKSENNSDDKDKEDNYVVDLVRSLLSGENNEIMNLIENGLDHGSIVEDLKSEYKTLCEGKDKLSEQFLAETVYPILLDKALTLVPKVMRGFLHVPYLRSQEAGEVFAVVLTKYRGGELMRGLLTYTEDDIKHKIGSFKSKYDGSSYRFIDEESDSDGDYE